MGKKESANHGGIGGSIIEVSSAFFSHIELLEFLPLKHNLKKK